MKEDLGPAGLAGSVGVSAAVLLMTLSGCGEPPSPNSQPNQSAAANNSSDNVQEPANSQTANAATNLASAAVSAPSNWSYSIDKDEMTDKKTYEACTTSINQVNLSAPYQPVDARLCIRQSPKFGFDVFVALNGDGQFMCQSYESCRISVRFGDSPAKHWSAIGPSDNSTNVIFLQNQRRVFAGIKGAPTTLVEATFFDNGDQTMRFETAGLVWPPRDQNSQ